MKVLHVNEQLAARGGIETYLLGLIPRLEAVGHPQAVAYASGESALNGRSTALPLLGQPGLLAEREGYQSMRQVLGEQKPDLVHLHNIYNVGAIRACLDAAPTILHAHDYRYVCPASSFFHRKSQKVCQKTAGLCCFGKAVTERCLTLRPASAVAYYRRVRWVARNAERFAHVIAPSRYCADRFVAAGFAPGKMTVLPYFCPIAPRENPRSLPQRPVVLFMGRGSAYKGYKTFVEAIGRLPKEISGRMIGSFNGERMSEIGEIAARAGCSGRLEVAGWIGRGAVAEAMGGATIFAFTSLWAETLGIVGLEALACGVPVVASDVGGVREWLEDGVNGRLVEPGNPERLASAISEMLESPQRMFRMGVAGLASIRDRFDPETHVGKLVDRYQGCLAA
jgi:glycosyltransferase involved in cell wall biosynthesis